MKYYLAALVAVVCVRGFAQVEEPLSPDLALDAGAAIEALVDADDLGDEAHHKGACHEVKLDETQKAQVKEAVYLFKKEGIKCKAELKLAALEYGKVLSDVKSEKAAAETAASALTSGITKAATAGTVFVNDMFFRILKPEQREAGLACLKSYLRHKHLGHHGHRRGHRGMGSGMEGLPFVP